MLICVDHEQVVCVMLYCVFVTCRCVTWVSRGTRLYRFSIFVVDFNKRPGGGGGGELECRRSYFIGFAMS